MKSVLHGSSTGAVFLKIVIFDAVNKLQKTFVGSICTISFTIFYFIPMTFAK